MYCKDCKFHDKDGFCINPNIREYDPKNIQKSDTLEYTYNESGGFKAGDYFGCVHFKQFKQSIKNKHKK